MATERQDAWRGEPRDHQLALVCLVAIGVALRLMYMTQPMRYDESVTYMYFARLPWSEALSTYTYPNNHVFHTLLVKACASVFGTSPWALRLPAFLAGSLVVPATYLAARALYGSRAALVATGIVASSAVLVLYSTNARGYALVVLSFLLLLWCAIRLLEGGPPRIWVAFAVIATLALWTIPVALYPIGTVALWYAGSASRGGGLRSVKPLALVALVAGALTLALYSPIIASSGIGSLTGNRFVTPSGWSEFLTELPRTLGDTLRSWTIGMQPVFVVVLLAFGLVALMRHRAVSRFPVGVPAAAFLWCAVLLAAIHRAPFPRVWLWLFPLAAALVGAGLDHVAQRWPPARGFFERRTGIIAVALSLALATSVVTSFAVLLSRDTGTFRDADDAAVALAAMIRPGDRVMAAIPTNGPLDFYLHRHGVDRGHLSLEMERAHRVFVIVDDGEGQTLAQLTARGELADTTRFTRPVVAAELPASRVFLYERRLVLSR